MQAPDPVMTEPALLREAVAWHPADDDLARPAAMQRIRAALRKELNDAEGLEYNAAEKQRLYMEAEVRKKPVVWTEQRKAKFWTDYRRRLDEIPGRTWRPSVARVARDAAAASSGDGVDARRPRHIPRPSRTTPSRPHL
jgi:hypothetical protein